MTESSFNLLLGCGSKGKPVLLMVDEHADVADIVVNEFPYRCSPAWATPNCPER